MTDDALFPTLLPSLQHSKGTRAWNHFQRTNLIWKKITTATASSSITLLNNTTPTITPKELKSMIKQHIQLIHHLRCQQKNSKLLQQCCTKIGTEPILWLPMSPHERILCLYYRLG